MRVSLSPSAGKRGDTVRIHATPSNPSEVTSVRVMVDYQFSIDLTPSGDGWAGEQVVPYEAYPGVYRLMIRAYDRSNQAIDSAEESFTVNG